jgi:hypothetical protein
MRLHNVLSCICTLAALFAPHLDAGPAARASVIRLTADSDDIVAGSVEAIAINRTISAIIHADRVLKGFVQGSSVSVTWTLPKNPFGYGKGGAQVQEDTAFSFCAEPQAARGPSYRQQTGMRAGRTRTSLLLKTSRKLSGEWPPQVCRRRRLCSITCSLRW